MFNFINNLNYIFQNKDAFLSYYFGNPFFLLFAVIIILFSIFIGWLTKRIWKKRKSIIIPFIIFIIPFTILFSFVLLKGAGQGPHPIDTLCLVYALVVISYWICCWCRNKVKKNKKLLGFGVVLLTVIVLILALLEIFASTFMAAQTHPTSNAKIIRGMGQLRSKAALIFSSEDGYDNLSCRYDRETNKACDQIDRVCFSGLGECKGDDAEGGKQDVVIHAIQDKYCAYTPLPHPTKWYCIDSRGITTETSFNPGQPGYCTENSFICSKEF